LIAEDVPQPGQLGRQRRLADAETRRGAGDVSLIQHDPQRRQQRQAVPVDIHERYTIYPINRFQLSHIGTHKDKPGQPGVP
jgi:hypothetical protein